jgi:hypothetical protein
MCRQAAELGDTSAMTYMMQQVAAVPEHLCFMLDSACRSGQLAAAQWLRQQHGAEWPAGLTDWPDDMVVWARAEGCDSPQVYLDEDY